MQIYYVVSLKYNQSPSVCNGWWDTCSAHVYSSMLMLALPWDSYPLWCAQVLFATRPPLLCCLSDRPVWDSLISPPRDCANILYAHKIIPPPDVKQEEFVLMLQRWKFWMYGNKCNVDSTSTAALNTLCNCLKSSACFYRSWINC